MNFENDREENKWEVEDTAERLAQAAEESEEAQKGEYYGAVPSSRPSSGDRRGASQLWLISYSDFMTILLIFFLAMYGYTYLARATLTQNQSKIIPYSDFTKMVYEMKDNWDSNLEVFDDTEKIIIKLPNQVLFSSGQSRLNLPALRALEELANSLKLINGDIVVQGHTDNVPVRGGPYASNWELSAARAFSVIEFLTEKGVPASRLAAWGFGENRPIVANDTEAHRRENRRIELVILKKKEGVTK